MWGLLAVVALLWPARTVGLLDGLPLEHTIPNAVLLGVVLPTLLWFHPRFLRTPLARVAIVALLALKALGVATITPDGWCVRFEPQRPLVKDAISSVPHSWDVRADWLSDQPACSAIVRRRADRHDRLRIHRRRTPGDAAARFHARHAGRRLRRWSEDGSNGGSDARCSPREGRGDAPWRPLALR